MDGENEEHEKQRITSGYVLEWSRVVRIGIFLKNPEYIITMSWAFYRPYAARSLVQLLRAELNFSHSNFELNEPDV